MWRGRRRVRDDYGWGRYVPVAERRAKAAREMEKLAKKGHPVSPVVIEGLQIAHTFWDKAWCDNLERYSDFENRLPRGRTYVRNGSVVDLQIAPGQLTAVVSASELYRVTVDIAAVPAVRWKTLCRDCAGAVDSLVELLQGRFSKAVMERICRQGTGLFPSPSEIRMTCSCPDWGTMCKHVAAVLYGIGARLDERPELLFRLRQVDEGDLIASAGSGPALDRKPAAVGKVLDSGDLSSIFGVEMEAWPAPEVGKKARSPRTRRAPEQPTDPAPVPANPAALDKGTPVRMLAGVYAGRTGVVSWVRVRDGKTTYALSFGTGADKATTQVTATSLGKKWEIAAASPPAGFLAKGVPVRMLAGRYAAFSGHISYVPLLSEREPDVTYTLALVGPDGRRARTTVNHSSFGRTWITASRPSGMDHR